MQKFKSSYNLTPQCTLVQYNTAKMYNFKTENFCKNINNSVYRLPIFVKGMPNVKSLLFLYQFWKGGGEGDLKMFILWCVCETPASGLKVWH